MTTTLANLLLGVDMEGGENFCDSVYNFLKNQGKDINLLTNSGFGVWSQSDTNKGLGYLDFDSGSVEPVVGETLTGATGAAVGKVIWVDVTGGTWGGANAAGTVYLGACSSTVCFQNNEDINGSVGGANMMTVNQPDGAVGTDGIIKNGAFVTDNDPPNDWTLFAMAVLTTEAAGKVGNCLMITEGGAANPYAASDSGTVVPGKIYKVTGYVKAGTEATYQWYIRDISNGQYIFNSGSMEETAGDWSTELSYTFEAPVGCTQVQVWLQQVAAGGAGTTIYYDEITCYEITPGCTAGTNVACDTWEKHTATDIYRQHNDATYTKDGSFYSTKIVPTTANLQNFYFPTGYSSLEEWEQQVAGRPVTFGAWVLASAANHSRIFVEDNSGTTYSSYHTGGGDYEWLEVTAVVTANPTYFFCGTRETLAGDVDGTTIVYISQAMLVFGWALGEGMYQPRLQEMIWLEKNIPSNTYDGLLDQSDLAFTDFNVESEFDAMIPKGAKVIAVHTEIDDSGSGAGLDVHLELRKDATAGTFFCNSVAGKPNDVHAHAMGLQPCDVNGDVDIHLDATGAGTLDINMFECHGVQVS